MQQIILKYAIFGRDSNKWDMLFLSNDMFAI